MADDIGLDAFLSEISSRDELLKTVKNQAPPPSEKQNLPVRGAPRVVEVEQPAKPKAPKAPKVPKAPTPAPTAPEDDAAIWDESEVASLETDKTIAAASANGTAKQPPGQAAAAKPPAVGANGDVKPRQRKHAYEYFNQWDRYDVDGEIAKLEDSQPAPEAEEVVPSRNDGLPPDLTASDLAKMAPIEIERRALNEKTKGNEAYKAGEYKEAVKAYTHSLRLNQDNAVVYANRGMCYLKLKQYRQVLADCTAAIQIDDAYTKAYLRRGIAHRRLSQTAQAISDLDIVLHREPHNKEAHEHRRCAQIEKETAERERRALAEANSSSKAIPGKTASGKKSSVVIEEVSDDSDDEEAGGGASLEETPEMRRLRLEMEAQSERERLRAEAAEKRGRERPGPFVDPQAMQDSNELISSLHKMNQGSLWGSENASKPEIKKEPVKESKEESNAVPKDGFAPSKTFTGARPGWVFKTGAHGLGYYREAAPPPKPEGMRKLAVEESDEESGSEEEVPIKKAAPAPAPAKTAAQTKKIAIVEDDDDDDDDEEVPIKVKKAEPAKPAATGMKKMAIVEDDDDDDDDEEVPIKVKKSAQPAQPPAKDVYIPESRAVADEKAAQAKERGTAALKRGEFRAAAEAYHECCKLQPSNHTHFSNLSLALLKFGQPEHAATAARRCTELEPTFAKGFFRLGQALRGKGDYEAAANELRTALKLAQKASPNQASKEAAEIARELSSCREQAAAAADASPAPSKPKEVKAAGAGETSAGSGSSGGGPSSPVSPKKGKVDEAAAVAVGKRAAELASKAGGIAALTGVESVSTLSQFERMFKAAWANGKGAADAAALRDVLALLPSGDTELSAFIKEGLTDDLLSGLVLASEKSGEPPAQAAARLAALANVRRFEMAWMFVGKAEKAAATSVFMAAAMSDPCDELAAAAKKYGVEI